MSKNWKKEAKDWTVAVAAALTAGKITKEVYDALMKKIRGVEELAERTSEAGFPEDLGLGVELVAEGTEVGAEVAAAVAAAA